MALPSNPLVGVNCMLAIALFTLASEPMIRIVAVPLPVIVTVGLFAMVAIPLVEFSSTSNGPVHPHR